MSRKCEYYYINFYFGVSSYWMSSQNENQLLSFFVA